MITQKSKKTQTIKIRSGDTLEIGIDLIGPDGEPYTPADDESVVFAVARTLEDEPFLTKEAVELVVRLTHDETKNLDGVYVFDVRIYDTGKTVVATPVIGTIEVGGVVNDDI